MSLLTTFLRRSIHCNRGVHYGVTYNEPNNVASGGICDDCGTVIKPIIWPRTTELEQLEERNQKLLKRIEVLKLELLKCTYNYYVSPRGIYAMKLEEILEQGNDGYDNLRSWDVATALHAAKDDIKLLREMIETMKTQNEVLLHRLNELQNQRK